MSERSKDWFNQAKRDINLPSKMEKSFLKANKVVNFKTGNEIIHP